MASPNCENKYITLLDLARQSKIITGDTACFAGKIQAGLPFSGYPTGVDIETMGSLGVIHWPSSGSTAVFSSNTVTTVFDVANPLSPFFPTFSGITGTSWTNPIFSAHTSGLTLPITLFSADTQEVGPFWFPSETGMTGEHIINTQVTGYTLIYSFENLSSPQSGPPLDPYVIFSGITSVVIQGWSAGTLDYKGPIDYLRSREDGTIDNKLTTKKLRVTGGALASTIGHVLTQIDELGNAGWRPDSGASADTNTFVVSGDLDGDTLTLTRNDLVAIPITGFSNTFTGNTSGECITDLFVTTIHGCSPVTFNSSIQHISSSATGLNSIAWGSGNTTNDNFSNILGGQFNSITGNSSGCDNNTIIGGSNNTMSGFGSSNSDNNTILGGRSNTMSARSIRSAIIGGDSNIIGVSAGTTANAVIVGGTGNVFPGLTPGTNSVIVGGIGITGSSANTTYVPNLNIGTVGSGTSQYNLGIDSDGFVVTGSSGSTFSWSDPVVKSGNTSGDCITDLFVSNIHSCSPLNINPLDEGDVFFGSTSGVTIDVINKRLGVGTSNPSFPLEIFGPTNEKISFVDSSGSPQFNISGSPTQMIRFVATDGTSGIGIGVRGESEPSFTNYGAPGDTHIRGGTNSHGLNIIEGKSSGSIHADYIRFYAGQGASSGNTPDIHIQGSGTTRGNVGINTKTPTEKLHVFGGKGLIEHDQNLTTTFTIQNLDLNPKANAQLQLLANNSGTTMSGFIKFGGPNYTNPGGSFGGSFISNALNIATGSGVASQRGNINIGSRRGADAETRFFGGSDDFDSASLLGTFYTSGLTITNMVNTDTLRVRDGATNGFVLTSDAIGNATWQANVSADTNTFVTGGTFPTALPDTLSLQYNTGGSAADIDLSSLRFSGGAGDCIVDLHITNLHGCSPITVHDPIQHISSTATGTNSIAWGTGTTAIGNFSHTEGSFTVASGIASHAEGGFDTDVGPFSVGTSATSDSAHAEGYGTLASGKQSHAEGLSTTASGDTSHAEGKDTVAGGTSSHAEGDGSIATGTTSHAEGKDTKAWARYAHAEGFFTTVIIDAGHAEGAGTTAKDSGGIGPSHAEGRSTLADGRGAHSEGDSTSAIGWASHAEGYGNKAHGDYTHAGGDGAIASAETAFVHYAVGDSPIIGTGAYSPYTAILGGRDQKILSGGTDGVIIGGQHNMVEMSENSGVFCGTFNRISGETSTQKWANTIIGGRHNNIAGPIAIAMGDRNQRYNSIVGGAGNIISGACDGSVIIGGSGNHLVSKFNGILYKDYSNNVIIGGENNTLENSDSSVIIGGIGLDIKGSLATTHVQNLEVHGQSYNPMYEIPTGYTSTSIIPDFQDGNVQTIVLSGGTAMVLDDPLTPIISIKPGGTYMVVVKQDPVTGDGTLSYGSLYLWEQGVVPVITTGTTAIDVLSFIGINLDGSPTGQRLLGVRSANFS